MGNTIHNLTRLINILLIFLVVFHQNCNTKPSTKPISRCKLPLSINEHQFVCSETSIDIMNKHLDDLLFKDGHINKDIRLFLHKISFIDDEMLKPDWLKVMIDVEWLTLQELNIEGIEENAFSASQFENLHVLIIGSMRLKRISGGIFNGLKNLKHLVFVRSILNKFEDNTLQHLEYSLEKFTINDCKQDLWIDNLFRTVKMRQFKIIRIENCVLKDKINATTFRGLYNVAEIHLPHNHIERIESGSFDISPTLKFVNLSSNDLTFLPTDLFKFSRPLPLKVILQNNPWHCDYLLKELWDFVYKSVSNVELTTIYCETPSEYKGQALDSLPSMCIEPTKNEIASLVSDSSFKSIPIIPNFKPRTLFENDQKNGVDDKVTNDDKKERTNEVNQEIEEEVTENTNNEPPSNKIEDPKEVKNEGSRDTKNAAPKDTKNKIPKDAKNEALKENKNEAPEEVKNEDIQNTINEAPNNIEIEHPKDVKNEAPKGVKTEGSEDTKNIQNEAPTVIKNEGSKYSRNEAPIKHGSLKDVKNKTPNNIRKERPNFTKSRSESDVKRRGSKDDKNEGSKYVKNQAPKDTKNEASHIVRNEGPKYVKNEGSKVTKNEGIVKENGKEICTGKDDVAKEIVREPVKEERPNAVTEANIKPTESSSNDSENIITAVSPSNKPTVATNKPTVATSSPNKHSSNNSAMNVRFILKLNHMLLIYLCIYLFNI